MIFLAVSISICYLFLIAAFIIGFDKIEINKFKNLPPKHTFSIIVPYRNEAHNLPILLKSISKINYPKNLFELILVNDDSTDDFKKIIDAFLKDNTAINIVLINNHRTSQSPKKDAITSAIQKSNFNWIVTTDADCKVPNNWLNLFNQTIEKEDIQFIAAPVKFKKQNSFLFHFQNLNFLSLLGSTIGSFGIKKPIMCNGANLCYHKKTFLQLNGFRGNDGIASGDDIFLLEKMLKNNPKRVRYLKSNEAVVETFSEKNWKLFFNQQLRWASKTTNYSNWFSKLVGITVFLENLLYVILLTTTIITGFYWKFFLLIFSIKTTIDIILITKISTFFRNLKSLKYYPVISIIYPFFIVTTAIISLFKNYQWKGRTFEQ
jgi:cellulose synthase/poly-beta-1,6-N-acetylglucosamine synthase-like glycosyltransferase